MYEMLNKKQKQILKSTAQKLKRLKCYAMEQWSELQKIKDTSKMYFHFKRHEKCNATEKIILNIHKIPNFMHFFFQL